MWYKAMLLHGYSSCFKIKGYVGYLLVIEAFTKYLWVNPIKHKEAETVEQHLSHMLNELQILHRVDFKTCHDYGT